MYFLANSFIKLLWIRPSKLNDPELFWLNFSFNLILIIIRLFIICWFNLMLSKHLLTELVNFWIELHKLSISWPEPWFESVVSFPQLSECSSSILPTQLINSSSLKLLIRVFISSSSSAFFFFSLFSVLKILRIVFAVE